MTCQWKTWSSKRQWHFKMPSHRSGLARSITPATWPVLKAPSTWRHLDVISDLHLHPSEPATFEVWQQFMQTTRADAVFILGDLFEVWVGDDVLNAPATSTDPTPSFEARCAAVLKSAAQRLSVFFMHGNRDFLLGHEAAQACGMTLLADPTVLELGTARWLLSHGDALCLDDTEYMTFRAQVRSAEWQAQFLQQSLPQRQAFARALRARSESRKHSGVPYADLDTATSSHWLELAHASGLIHGHTHRPGQHELAQGRVRVVLSDWDASASPARAEVLRLSLDRDAHPHLQRLSIAQAAR